MQQSSNYKPIKMIDGHGKNVLNFAGGLVLLAVLVSGGMMGCQTCNADQQEKQETEAKQQANPDAAPLVTEEQIAERKKRNAYIKEQLEAGRDWIGIGEWSRAKTAAENIVKIAPDNVSAQELKRIAFWAPLTEKTSGNLKYKVHPTRPVCEISGLNKKHVATLVLPQSIRGKKVIRLGSAAFYRCRGLTSVTIPSSVTSIGWRAFYECSDLTKISVEEDNPVYLSIDGVLLTKAKKTLVQYPEGKVGIRYVIPSSVTRIGEEAFYCCEGLTTVTIPSSVTSIGDAAFYKCKGLKSVTIPSSVTSIGEKAFYHCEGLTTVTIPSSVTSIGDATFFFCFDLTSVTIPSSVTSIGDLAFCNCEGLTTVTIPSSVTSIGAQAFSDCKGLTSVTIPSSVTSIGRGAFSDCKGLTSVTIPSSVTRMGDEAFNRCSGLTKISVEKGNPVCLSIDGVLFTKDRKTLVQYPEGKLGPRYVIPSSVTSIGEWAFGGCSGLTTVTIPSSVTSIGEWAFGGCKGLKSVTIPSSVTSIGDRAFFNCKGLTSVTIPKGVKIGKDAFRGCPWQPGE